ncbi:MAG: Oxidoreductase, partial [uncultured Sulfurovum sp.]
VLSGKYNQDPENAEGRFATYLKSVNKRQRAMANRFMNNKTLASTQKYLGIAKRAGIDPVTLATAWSKQFDFVASTIIGATSAEQLDPIFEAMDLELSSEVLAECNKVHDEILYPMG